MKVWSVAMNGRWLKQDLFASLESAKAHVALDPTLRIQPSERPDELWYIFHDSKQIGTTQIGAIALFDVQGASDPNETREALAKIRLGLESLAEMAGWCLTLDDASDRPCEAYKALALLEDRLNRL